MNGDDETMIFGGGFDGDLAAGDGDGWGIEDEKDD